MGYRSISGYYVSVILPSLVALASIIVNYIQIQGNYNLSERNTELSERNTQLAEARFEAEHRLAEAKLKAEHRPNVSSSRPEELDLHGYEGNVISMAEIFEKSFKYGKFLPNMVANESDKYYSQHYNDLRQHKLFLFPIRNSGQYMAQQVVLKFEKKTFELGGEREDLFYKKVPQEGEIQLGSIEPGADNTVYVPLFHKGDLTLYGSVWDPTSIKYYDPIADKNIEHDVPRYISDFVSGSQKVSMLLELRREGSIQIKPRDKHGYIPVEPADRYSGRFWEKPMACEWCHIVRKEEWGTFESYDHGAGTFKPPEKNKE